jgi:hypothetical protein
MWDEPLTIEEASKLVDSAAGTFTATYDTEGELVSEVYANSMCVNTTYNSVNEATRTEYLKTTNCAESKPAVWYSDERVPAIRGELMSPDEYARHRDVRLRSIGTVDGSTGIADGRRVHHEALFI